MSRKANRWRWLFTWQVGVPVRQPELRHSALCRDADNLLPHRSIDFWRIYTYSSPFFGFWRVLVPSLWSVRWNYSPGLYYYVPLWCCGSSQPRLSPVLHSRPISMMSVMYWVFLFSQCMCVSLSSVFGFHFIGYVMFSRIYVSHVVSFIALLFTLYVCVVFPWSG